MLVENSDLLCTIFIRCLVTVNLVKVLIPGMDGYIGWPLSFRMLSLGHQVCGIDNFSRRKNVEEMGSHSALPILPMEKRMKLLEKEYGENKVRFFEGDLLDQEFTENVMQKFQPDVIVHLGEQPSAPYSMIDQQHNVYTQKNNVIGTLNLIYSMHRHVPKCHLIKLGTMGEYGYDPGLDIAEGFFEIEYNGKKARVPYPRLAGSWYHWSKVYDSNNIMFACKIWGIHSTDIMQGIVYGTKTDEITDCEHHTRFDFDEAFGTALNRFCAQAVIGHPLTVHGVGGQTRGFLALSDSIQCICLLMDNPADEGEYRVVNQFDEQYSIMDLAKKVESIGNKKGLNVEIKSKENPRLEAETHYYNADHSTLKKLGFKRTREIDDEISIMLDHLINHKERIEQKKEVIIKDIKWKESGQNKP